MHNGLRHTTQARQQTSLKVDPKVVLSSQVLQLSGAELEQLIESELVENPALERIEEYEDPITIDEIMQSIAPEEMRPGDENHELRRSLPPDAKVDHDWLDFASSSDSLWDHLIAQMKTRVGEEYWPLAVYLVGSVNERGYLTCTVEDAALDCETSLEEAEAVLKQLRACEPAGVGASDIRECLLLQLRKVDNDAEKLARLMLSRHWDELVARNKRAIARAYKAPEELVEEAFEVILNLHPFPGESFTRYTPLRREKAVPAQPDIVLTLDEAGWLVEVPGPSPISLRVSRAYEVRRKEIDDKLRPDAAERRHVTEYCERAQRFLDALGQRRQQLARIGTYLVEHQTGFVQTGEYKFLKSLTRSQVAKDLGVHESTVSRATAGKFVQIATRDVVSFDVFFKPALRIQKMIEEILESENPGSPLSDERIAQMLAAKGVNVARRTVNKYRDRTKLLSSRLRRSA